MDAKGFHGYRADRSVDGQYLEFCMCPEWVAIPSTIPEPFTFDDRHEDGNGHSLDLFCPAGDHRAAYIVQHKQTGESCDSYR